MSHESPKASWLSLPHKSQLVVLALCRFAEPLSNTSVLSYLYYLLKSFDDQLSPSEIARQAGYVATSFALGQFLTGTIWGRLSDSRGRRFVLLIGLSGTICSALVFGFCQKLWVVIAARLCAGLLNGNVGVLRTMISEIVVEKKHQSRAFLIMPMCFNLGAIIGPIIGGLLADPCNPQSALYWLVGRGSVLGGRDGIKWMRDYPYALPNVISAVFLTTSLLLCWLFLEETHPERAHQKGFGIRTGHVIINTFSSIFRSTPERPRYTPLAESDDPTQNRVSVNQTFEETLQYQDERILSTPTDLETQIRLDSSDTVRRSARSIKEHGKLKLSEIFTSNVILTLISFMLCPLHNATFMQLWPLFLSTPTSSASFSLPFKFSGGLGLSTSDVGYSMSVLGCIGVILQIFVFPRIQGRFGTMTCYRTSLWIFPIAYALIPYLSVLPSTSDDHAAGTIVWAAIIGTLLVQVVARTFALPSTVILLNNSAPNRQSLGTIHGAGSSLSSLSRVIGPLSGAFLLGYGEKIGVVGLVWWIMAVFAVFGALSSLFIYEGQGLEKVEEPTNRA